MSEQHHSFSVLPIVLDVHSVLLNTKILYPIWGFCCCILSFVVLVGFVGFCLFGFSSVKSSKDI